MISYDIRYNIKFKLDTHKPNLITIIRFGAFALYSSFTLN